MKHYSVLLKESIDMLNIKTNGIYVDATLGAGGHSEEILKKLDGTGHLFCFDQDIKAIDLSQERLKDYPNVTFINANFANIKLKLLEYNIEKIDGIIFDLGLSSMQIDDANRGFSYMHDAVLDMRMNERQTIRALDVVNEYSYDELIKIFFEYGEEKNARAIANNIIKNRPILRTSELVKITDKVNFTTKGHSAKRVFQALRIYVNDEINVLVKAVNDAINLLNINGVIACITFHSLEDKIIKQTYKKYTTDTTPKNLPIKNVIMPLKLINNKPIYPTENELLNNSRSRSAKLRGAIKQNNG